MTPPTIVLLVRHALTPTTGAILPGRAQGLPLSDEGRRQADAVARRLAALPKIAAIYASPLERARETAVAIARARGLAIRIERGLIELDVGAWTGRSLKRVARRPEWRAVQRHPRGFPFPQGEAFPEVQGRIVSPLARLGERHAGARPVAGAHPDPIKATGAPAPGTPPH